MDNNTQQLSYLYSKNEFKPIFSALSQCPVGIKETELDDLEAKVQSPGQAPYVLRQNLIGLFRSLEKLAVGKLVLGRRGSKTRFLWNRQIGEVVAAARESNGSPGAVLAPQASTSRVEEPTMTTVTHQFVLRPNYTVQIKLPEDFDAREAERLGRFILALPFNAANESKI